MSIISIIKPLLLFLLFISALANAQSFVYVTDKFELPIRANNKIQKDNILKMLPSGAKLKILATDNGWTEVIFEQTTGWILSRYLSNNPPARAELKQLKYTHNANKLLINRQKSENKLLAKELKNLKKANAQLAIRSAKAEAEKKYTEETYKNSLALEHSNEKLVIQNLQFKSEIQLLKDSNIGKQDNNSRNWLIVGAVILFFGILLGFILAKSNNKRRI